MKKQKVGWEKAITEILSKYNGICTLKELYQEVPKLISSSRSKDLSHSIRGYLRRLKNKALIKQIGLSTYALKNQDYKEHFYESIMESNMSEKDFLAVPLNKIHGRVEGMLVEIGNMRGFETYTPDKNVIFNGKKLADLISYQKVPHFTYLDRIKKIEQIDVLWLKDGYPIKTFDVETSTDFTKALVRCYQLKYFITECFMIADEKKRSIFEDRIKTSPFNQIEKKIKYIENITVFKDYQNILRYNKLKSNSMIL